MTQLHRAAKPHRWGGENGLSTEQWQAKCRQLTLERERLQQELHSMTKERDDYLRAVYALLPTPELPCSEEEMFAPRGANPTLTQLLAELQSLSEA